MSTGAITPPLQAARSEARKPSHSTAGLQFELRGSQFSGLRPPAAARPAVTAPPRLRKTRHKWGVANEAAAKVLASSTLPQYFASAPCVDFRAGDAVMGIACDDECVYFKHGDGLLGVVIVVVKYNGEPVRTFSIRFDEAHIIYPGALTVLGEELFVCDGSHIRVFNKRTGAQQPRMLTACHDGSGNTRAITHDGTLLYAACVWYNHTYRVAVLHPTNGFVCAFGEIPRLSYFRHYTDSWPHGTVSVAVSKGKVYVADESLDMVTVYDVQTRELAFVFGDKGELEYPRAICIHNEIAFVTDSVGVQVFSARTGHYIARMSSTSHMMAFGRDGTLFSCVRPTLVVAIKVWPHGMDEKVERYLADLPSEPESMEQLLTRYPPDTTRPPRKPDRDPFETDSDDNVGWEPEPYRYRADPAARARAPLIGGFFAAAEPVFICDTEHWSDGTGIVCEGDRLYVPCRDGRGVAVLTRGGKLVRHIGNDGSLPQCGGVAIAGSRLYATSPLLSEILVFSLDTGECVRKWRPAVTRDKEGLLDTPTCIGVRNDCIYVGDKAHALSRISLDERDAMVFKEIPSLGIHRHWPRYFLRDSSAIAFYNGEVYIADRASICQVTVFDADTGEFVCIVGEDSFNVTGVAVDRGLVFTADEQVVRVFSATECNQIAALPDTDGLEPRGLCLSDDGLLYVTTSKGILAFTVFPPWAAEPRSHSASRPAKRAAVIAVLALAARSPDSAPCHRQAHFWRLPLELVEMCLLDW